MRDITVIGGLTLLVLGGTALAGAVGQETPLPIQMEEIKAGLYVITGSGGNVAVRVTSDSVVLVDDKFERNHDDIVQLVSQVSDSPIAYVIGTHHHGDHMGGNPAFAAHAKIIAHANARVNMLTGGQSAAPRVVFRRTSSVFVGDIEIKAHHFGPGHTNGDAVVEFPDLRTIHTGDLVVEGTPFIDYANGGNTKDWVETLGKILELDFDTAIPGHGPILTKADVRTFRGKLETVIDRVRSEIAAGATRDDIASRVDTTDLDWPLAPVRIQNAFDELTAAR